MTAKYKGLKVVPMRQAEIKLAVKRFTDFSRGARAVITIVEEPDGFLRLDSTCVDRSHTVRLLEYARGIYAYHKA